MIAYIPDFKNWWEVYQVSTNSWCLFFVFFKVYPESSAFILLLIFIQLFCVCECVWKNKRYYREIFQLIYWFVYRMRVFVAKRKNEIEWAVRQSTHRWRGLVIQNGGTVKRRKNNWVVERCRCLDLARDLKQTCEK